jgi:hypothetical protein
VAAWLNVAGQAFRPAARRRETFLARIGFVLLFAFVAAWAAAAPQAGLSLGERLHLSFSALAGFCAIIAATSALRHQFAIINDPSLILGWKSRRLADLLTNIFATAHDLIPSLPFFVFLLALEVISPTELLMAALEILAIVISASAITNVPLSIALVLVASLVVLTRRLTYFETTIAVLFALHLGLKAYVGWTAITSTSRLRRNLNDEAITGLHPFEVAALHRKRLWRELGFPFIGLAFVNVAFVLMILFGVPFPATLEQKLALSLTLTGGTALLFIDSSALLWRGTLSAITTFNPRASYARSLTLIIGVPWAAAWIFAALHSGEAFTLNEGAAYFFMWLALSGSVSWIARVTAKEKIQRDLRRLLSEQ